MVIQNLAQSDLNLRPLWHFLQIAEAGSFSRAAAQLSRDQPSLSKEIRGLETQYGVEVFYRTGRGVTLTAEGEVLARHARLVLRALVATRTEMEALQDRVAGNVTIAVPPLFGAVLNVALVASVRRQWPDLRLSFREGFAADVVGWLTEGTADLAVLYNPPKVSTLLSETLAKDHLCLLGTPDLMAAVTAGEVSAAELAELPMVIAPRPHKLRMLVEDFVRQSGCEMMLAAEVTGTATMLELVSGGLGYTVLPRSLIEGALGQAELDARPLAAAAPRPELCLSNAMQKPLTTGTRAVMNEIRAIFRARS